jgi:maltose O-acetyltransferase
MVHMASSTDYFAGDQRTNSERMLAGDFYIADDPESGRRAQLREI